MAASTAVAKVGATMATAAKAVAMTGEAGAVEVGNVEAATAEVVMVGMRAADQAEQMAASKVAA